MTTHNIIFVETYKIFTSLQLPTRFPCSIFPIQPNNFFCRFLSQIQVYIE